MNISHSLNHSVYFTKISLVDDYLPLYLPLVKGGSCSAFVDSGIKSMFPQLQQTMLEAKVSKADLRYVIQTHSHADHIGNNVALKAITGCLIAGHKQFAHFHSDCERHYQEWARPVPSLLPDTPELRASVFDWFDTPHNIDIYVNEGTVFDLGGGVTLESFNFPGHMKNDMGWLETSTRTMILGDSITATDWPHFHKHDTVPGYRNTLHRLRTLLPELKVSMAFETHFGPLPVSEAQALIAKALAFLDTVDRAVLRVIAQNDAVHLREIWTRVAGRLNKLADHHALSSINAHVLDFLERGLIREVEPLTYALR